MLKRALNQITVLILLLCASAPINAYAQSTADSATQVQKQALQSLQQEIAIDKERTQLLTEKVNALQSLYDSQWAQAKPEAVTQQIIAREQLALAEANADKVSLLAQIAVLKQQVNQQDKHIAADRQQQQDLKVTTPLPPELENQLAHLSARIAYATHKRTLLKAQLAGRVAMQSTLARLIALQTQVTTHLKQLYQTHQNTLREAALVARSQAVQAARTTWLQQLKADQAALEAFSLAERNTHPQAIYLALRIYHAQEKIFLSELRLSLAQLHDEVVDASDQIHRALPIGELDATLTDAKKSVDLLNQYKQQIALKQGLIEKKIEIHQTLREKEWVSPQESQAQLSLLNALRNDYQENLSFLNQTQLIAYENVAHLQKLLTKAISVRQTLPGLDWQAWQPLFVKISHLPQSTWHALLGISDHLKQTTAKITAVQLLGCLMLAGFWFILWYQGRYAFPPAIITLKSQRHTVSGNVAYVSLQLLARNFLGLIIAGAGLSFLLLSGIPFVSYRFLLYLALVWFAVKSIIGIARLSLLETMSNVSGADVKLYHRLKWVFILGGVVTALTVMAYQFHMDFEVRDLFMRLLMAFLLVLSLILFRGRKVVPPLVSHYLHERHLYLRRAISLLCTLIPLTLFMNAVIGLLGYNQLAWVLSYYQIMFLLILSGYVVVRGLLIDFMAWVASQAIRHLKNGWLLSQALLKPLDQVLKILLFFGAVFLLFSSYGWTRDSWVVQRLNAIITYPLLKFETGGEITLLSIAAFVILVAIVYWAARWTREFAYRWLYQGVRDRGVRNSLAIFTQYAVIALGAVLTLRVLGIDFSGLAFILGGLAVGLGFGLRDFTNNIISGLALLIERPVREGDLVSVGNYEGKVMHIGLRSMIIKSWDYMEVVVPNAETFNKTFTNWTHQDSIVRTVVPIKIHRRDDPLLIQQVILNVLEELPAILKDPEPQVFLKELDDILIEFEVRYFINLEAHSRVEVRSMVLFSIWERFQSIGIRPPYPQQDIQIIATDALPAASAEKA